MKNYTPGPWSVTFFKSGGKAIVQRGQSGGFQVNGFCTETQNADAKLISAAPDLLEALMMCLDCEFPVQDKEAITKALAAIEKAGCKS